MADTKKWFKFSPLGGFRRQDVINYIEALLKKHHEEIEAYRTGTETLRRERDEACTQLAALQSKMEDAEQNSKPLPTLPSDMDLLSARITQLNIDKTLLSENLQKLEGAREADRTVLLQLQSLLSEKEAAMKAFQTDGEDRIAAATVRAEEIESQARNNAREIESEARKRADRLCEQITRLCLETKANYTALCKNAEGVSAEAVRDLDRARGSLIGTERMFDVINNCLESFSASEKPSLPDKAKIQMSEQIK